MHSYDVVGYAYDADIHCVQCASSAHSQDDLDNLSTRHIEEWGGTLDSDPTPVFRDSEGADDDSCGDCGRKLIED